MKNKLKCSVTGANILIPFIPKTKIVDNSMWGLNRFIPNAESENVLVEHGLFWGDTLLEYHVFPKIQLVYVFSPYRKRFLEQNYAKKPHIKIIDISQCFDRFITINFGFNAHQEDHYDMLYFNHSSSVQKVGFNVKEITENIKNIQKIRKTTLYVVFFYKDFTRKLFTKVKSTGAIPICFGRRFDSNFLVRQISFLRYTNIVFCYSPGTQIFYAYNLKKPICLVKNFESTVKEKKWAPNFIYRENRRQIKMLGDCLPTLKDKVIEDPSFIDSEETKKIFNFDPKINLQRLRFVCE